MSFFKKLFGKKDKKEESVAQNVISKQEKTKKQTLSVEEIKNAEESERERRERRIREFEENNPKEIRLREMEEEERIKENRLKELEEDYPKEERIKQLEEAENLRKRVRKEIEEVNKEEVLIEEYKKEEPAEILIEKPVEILIEETIETNKKPKRGRPKKNKEVLIKEVVEIVEETIERPAEVLLEETIERPAEVLLEETIERPAEVLLEETIERPAEVLLEETIERPAETLIEETIENPAEVLAEKTKENSQKNKETNKKSKRGRPKKNKEVVIEDFKEEPEQILIEEPKEEPEQVLIEEYKEEPEQIAEELEEIEQVVVEEIIQEVIPAEKPKEKNSKGKFNIFKAMKLDKHNEKVVKEEPTEIITEITPIEITTSEEEIPAIPEVVESEEIEVQEIPSDTTDEETPVEKPTKPKKAGLFKRLFSGLTKTRDNIVNSIENVLKNFKKIDEDLYEELEETLIMADFGVDTTLNIMEKLRVVVKEEKLTDVNELNQALQKIITDILLKHEITPIVVEDRPNVILVIGVNGAGKTTSIGKLSYQFKQEEKKVVVAAADTFRAAAIEQLSVWANRAGVEIIKHTEGSDPASVVYDGIAAAKARKADILICDTAGRLQNKINLMKELEKIGRIIDREYPEAHKEVLIVLDATTGQNAISQVKTFNDIVKVDGIILTKLDGTAKGGAVVGICGSMNVPVKYIGVGEKIEDLQVFNPQAFAQALFAKAEAVIDEDNDEDEEIESEN